MTPSGFVPFETRTETIAVRFGADETLHIQSTRHGPVLPVGFFGADKLTPDGHVIALAWTALSEVDRTIEAGHEITRARHYESFREALQAYVAPMQNMVFASTAGEIGFIAPALVPMRSNANEGAGLVPTAGWKPENDWTGIVPFAGLPQAHNPDAGMIITANNKIVPDDYSYMITQQWDLPYRAARIEDLLALSREHTVESFINIQMDNGSYFAERFLPLLLANAENGSDTAEARERLAAWTHRMDGDKAEPLIFTAWMRELTRRVFSDELKEQFESNWRFHPVFMEAVLTSRDGQDKWCDNVNTTETAETCKELINESLETALEELRARYGTEMKDWRWDKAHPVVNRHIPGSFLPLLGETLTITRPSSGGNHTINRGQHQISGTDPFDNVHAAGFRAVYDLGDLDASRYMTSTGQSGNPYSPAYDTFANGWAAGDSITIETDPEKIVPVAQLQLQPSNSITE